MLKVDNAFTSLWERAENCMEQQGQWITLSGGSIIQVNE